jgi:3',5'-cyclic AMP phosphodiesterase CpdA
MAFALEGDSAILTIAQITDLHVTTPDDPLNSTRNDERLGRVLAAIHRLRPRPVAIFASGDLVDRGAPAEYVRLQAVLKSSEIPIYFGVGNHDARGPFLEALAGPWARADDNGFIQYAVEFDDLRVIMCDTLDEGHHGGAFCEKRAAGLARLLDARPDAPTLVLLHHPPVDSGISWMDPADDRGWIERLRKVLQGRRQIRALTAGHLHRGFSTSFAGHPMIVSPATSTQLTLDLTEVDMAHADGREILVDEPPAYMVHMWSKGELVSHTALAGDFPGAVYYTKPFKAGSA